MGAYAPFDNATLVFDVYSSFATDSKTGNRVPVTTAQTYVANIQLQPNGQDFKPGIDENKVPCRGRLLTPSTFSSKVQVGMTAKCTVNGITGTLRVTNIGSQELLFARSTLHQGFIGEFKQIGKGG